MRWPLRNQILVPMVCLMVATLVGVSAINACLSLQRTRTQIADDLRQLAATLSAANFPLTDAVLQKMRGLSGADFVLTDARGGVLSSSAGQRTAWQLPPQPPGASGTILGAPIVVDGRAYFHTAVRIRVPQAGRETAVLHMLYPKATYDKAWRQSVYPPLLLGVLAVVLVGVVGSGIASRVTRPLRTLQSRVDEIAEGRFHALPTPERDDEVADLAHCIDRMSTMLARYEDQVRHSEQLRTLGQLGGGLAHQLRNAVTGCRLAIELHARGCPSGTDNETLQVAIRQLALMDQHLQRFLALGRKQRRPHVPFDLRGAVQNVRTLVESNARHVGVGLRCVLPAEAVAVCGDQDALEQLLTNLVVNAIEAAARIDPSRSDVGEGFPGDAGRDQPEQRSVQIAVRPVDGRVLLEVADTGPGPAAALSATLFEPFVTDKPDGTGLGLSVAREIAADHGGAVCWQRRDAQTCFVVELPLCNTERHRVPSVSG
jgi:signal transduction histidine kinase